MRPRILAIAAAIFMLVMSLPAEFRWLVAQAPITQQSSPSAPAPAEEWSATQHSLKLGTQTIPYTASAGTTLLKNDAGDPIGLMYSAS